MERLCPATEADKAALTRLWLAAFPSDTPADVESFWETGHSPAHAYGYWVDGELVSMAFLLPTPLCYAGGCAHAGYVFAAATLPERQGQGYFSRLMEGVFAHARDRGMDALFLHPATPALYDFYRRFGFQTAFYAATLALSRSQMEERAAGDIPPLTRHPLPPPSRREWLKNHGFATPDWDRAAWRFELSGDYFTVPFGGMGYTYMDGDTLVVPEWLCEEEEWPTALAALCRRFRFTDCRITCPSSTGEGFGMLKPLTPAGEELPARRWYMGPTLG